MKYLAFIFVAFLLLITCEQPTKFVRDNPNDTEGTYFEVYFSNLDDNTFIGSGTDIKIGYKGENTLLKFDSLNLYFNDSLLASSNILPFSYFLNTTKINSGYHTIWFETFGKHGQYEKKSISVGTGTDNLFLDKISTISGVNVNLQWHCQSDSFFNEFQIHKSSDNFKKDDSILCVITNPNVQNYLYNPPHFEKRLYYKIVLKNSFGDKFETATKYISPQLNLIGHYDIVNSAYDVEMNNDSIIFVASDDGLQAFIYKNSNFISLAQETNVSARDLAIGKDGTIFMGNNRGLYAFSFNGNSFSQNAFMETSNLNEIVIGQDGTIFTANYDNGLKAYNYNGSSFSNIANINDGGNPFGVAIGIDGTIYLANYEDGVRVYSFDGETFINTWHFDLNQYVRDIAIGIDGTIFTAEVGYLRAFKFDGSNFTSKQISNGGKVVAIGPDNTIFLVDVTGFFAYKYTGDSFISLGTIRSVYTINNMFVLSDGVVFSADRSTGLNAYQIQWIISH